MSCLSKYEKIDGGYVAFGGDPKEGKITDSSNVAFAKRQVRPPEGEIFFNSTLINGVNALSKNISNELPFDLSMPALEDISTFNFSSDHENDDEEADINNMDTTIQVSLVPTTRIHKDHPLDQVIRDLHSTTQTRNLLKNFEEHREAQIHAKVDGKKVIISEASIRRDLQFEDEKGVNCLPTATIFEQLALIGTVASAIIYLAINQKFNFSKWTFEGSAISNDPQHTPTLLQSSSSQPLKTQKHMKPKRKVTEVPQPSDLMEHVKDKVVYKELVNSLVRAATTVSSLEAEQDSESSYDEQSLGEDASKHRRTSAIDADEGITLVSTYDDAEMFDADKYLHGEEVFAAKRDENVVEKKLMLLKFNTAATTNIISIDEVTLGQAFAELKHTKSKAKAKGIVFHEPEEPTTTTKIPKLKSQDKGKTIMIEEPVKLKKKDQIMI
nr:hypothetical protein [Tanacetum cinerariifolium]